MPLKFTLIIFLLALTGVSAQAATYFVRTDGGSAVQCLGTTNAAYDGSGSGEACAFSTVAIGITASACGDTIKLVAGNSWDTASVYTLPNKSCTLGNEITITTTATLPDARVSPASAASMPRLRATSSDGIFRTATNAGYWILDGLNMTDNAPGGTQNVNYLVDAATNSGAHHITITRSLLYPKEVITDPTTRNRPLTRGIGYEGTDGLIKWNYIYGFSQRDGLGNSNNTGGIGCFTCSTTTFTDNFLDGQYVSIFTGGVRENHEFSATLSGTINATQADFSSTTGLVNGVTYVRFDMAGVGTLTGSPSSGYNDAGGSYQYQTLTRTSGFTSVNFDGAGTYQGFHIRLVDVGGGPTYRGRLKAVATNAMTVVWEYGANAPAGTYNWTVSEVAAVSNVSGSTVTFAGVGPNALLQSPGSSAVAYWRQTQVVHDLTITKNTFSIDIALAQAEHAASGNSPKGWAEFKAGDTILWDGNYHTGYPSAIGVTQHSDEGWTPWTKVKNLTITNNFVNPIFDVDGSRQFLIVALTDPYNSNEPGSDTVVSNNLVLNCIYPVQLSGSHTTLISHNTFINPYTSPVYGSRALQAEGSISTAFTFIDNIVAYNTYGAHCFIDPYTLGTCWPSGVWNHNVVVDNLGSGVTVNTWGTASILSPIKTAFSQVGFVNTATNDWRLAGSSDFKGDGTGGSDPGVDWGPLVSALGFDPAGAPATSKGKVTIGGKVTIK